MKSRKQNALLNLLLGTGLYLLETMRDRLPDTSDIADRARDGYNGARDRAKDVYDTASDRVGRASDVLRGRDHQVINAVTAALIGVGIGVGMGVLLAPSSGEETREKIADRVRDKFSRMKEPVTGTFGD